MALRNRGRSAAMAALRFPHPPAVRRAPLAAGGGRAGAPQANYLLNVLRLKAGAAFWCSTGATANGGRASPPRQERRCRSIVVEQSAAQTRAARPALPVRAAQARAPRLHGAEGGRDGRLAAPAGHDAAHPGRARQSRAHARERHRGGRAMRHPDAFRRSPSRSKFDACRARGAERAAGVLRRGGRREGPGRGACRRARGVPDRRRRSPC